ncbi:MAG: DUF2062 domain-containing protein [Litoreibacter sp.]
MVFKRRTPKSWALWALHLLWPQGGWGRAATYVKYRLRRLPDSPHRIARGIFAGVLTSFTPLFGLHFLLAAIMARAIRGNIFAAIMATFFGNPITFVAIAAVALKLGHFLLGTQFDENVRLGERFSGAWRDLWENFLAIFTPATAHWDRLGAFNHEIFLPYLVGGVIPGTICAFICYYLSVPLITAYQNRRKGRLKAKWEEIKAKKAAAKKTEGLPPGE